MISERYVWSGRRSPEQRCPSRLLARCKEARRAFQTRKCLKSGAEQKPRLLRCELKKPGARRNIVKAPGGEPETDNSAVDGCPGERPRQEGLGRYPSAAGKAKRRGGAQQGLFQHPASTSLSDPRPVTSARACRPVPHPADSASSSGSGVTAGAGEIAPRAGHESARHGAPSAKELPP